MKILSYAIVLTLAFGACQSKTYQQAMTVNHLRFGTGLQNDDANFLMESYDLVQFIDALSVTALERSTLKERYLLAQDASKAAKELDHNFKMEAGLKRIKLSSVLSEPNDEIWQKLSTIPEDKFDMMYSQYMQTSVLKLVNKMNAYVDNGTDKRLIEFADTVLDGMRPTIKTLEKEKATALSQSEK